MPTGVYSRSLTPLADRFWLKVNKKGSIPGHCPELGPCWIWIGDRNVGKRSYGRIGAGGAKGPMLLAHRVSWELEYGPIPFGMRVLHKCDVYECVRPTHLFLGTDADNSADMVAKGRSHALRPKYRARFLRDFSRSQEEGTPFKSTGRNRT